MMLRRIHVAGTLLAVATALAAYAPVASADCDRGCDDGGGRGGRRGYAAARWEDRGCSEHSGRDYFYREVFTGRTNSHISALRPRWGCRGTSPVERIDIRTGRLLGSYIWDGDSWEKCGREDYGRYEGRGRRDARRYEGRGDYGRYEGRGRGDERYAGYEDDGGY